MARGGRSAIARAIATGIVCALTSATAPASAASEHAGQVTFNGLPVPGATVTLTREGETRRTISDDDGRYRLAALADGVWHVSIELSGFATVTSDIVVSRDPSSPSVWPLKMLPIDAIVPRLASPDAATAPTTAPAAPPAVEDANAVDRGLADGDLADDGLLVNGSVNNAAASPFAQRAAFGNERRGERRVYTGALAIVAGNSAWDARPYAFAGAPRTAPRYADVQALGTFGGPLRIPRLIRRGPNLFLSYQHTSDHAASTQSALMPTALERAGDFSQTRDAGGQPARIVDPLTGAAFADGIVPADRISAQARGLLQYYPRPTFDADGRFNYQQSVLKVVRQDGVQARVIQPQRRGQISSLFAFQRTATDSTTIFGFEDETATSALDTSVTWTRRLSQAASMRLRYQFTRTTLRTTPYFAHRDNVSGELGITGNNQEPANWGPPSLVFASGLAGLTDALPASSSARTQVWSVEVIRSLGRHTMTTGGAVKPRRVDIRSQQDPRGTFAFTGDASGWDFADFLLGIPSTSAIAFGNADKFFEAMAADAYISNDWRATPTLTVTTGVRWEYEAPFTERLGRLVNLDIAPAFADISPVTATDSVGALTGRRYPTTLLQPDRGGVQPRAALSWRPLAASSLVIRAGYGLYRNANVYQPIATQLAQQPPLSTTLRVANSEAHPLTLARGFEVPTPNASDTFATNTFAVDPDFRVGQAHVWQLSVQRDLPRSLTILASYSGTRGDRLMQQVLPHTSPPGAEPACASCPSGFVYLTSGGRSSRHAGAVQVRRRLRDGLAGVFQYTLASAHDDAATFVGADLATASIAQDWTAPRDEWGRSTFDQRHLLTTQFEYTPGAAVSSGLADGLTRSLLHGWMLSGQLTAGSGLPLTPVFLRTVTGTGVIGTLRPDFSGDPDDLAAGFYANPAAFAAPQAGRWGNARRNSLTGPAQFTFNAALSRSIPLGRRLTLDWRLEATNVLNRVTFATIDTVVGSPQFGLPTRANPRRKLQSSVRVRF